LHKGEQLVWHRGVNINALGVCHTSFEAHNAHLQLGLQLARGSIRDECQEKDDYKKAHY
jgi:hypothetical protein